MWERWIGQIGDRIGRHIASAVAAYLPEERREGEIAQLEAAVERGTRAATRPSRRFRIGWTVVAGLWVVALVFGYALRPSTPASVEVDHVGPGFSLEVDLTEAELEDAPVDYLSLEVSSLGFDFESSQLLDIELPIAASSCETVKALWEDSECETPSGPLSGVGRVAFRPVGSQAALELQANLEAVRALRITVEPSVSLTIWGIEDSIPRLTLVGLSGASGLVVESAGHEREELDLRDSRDPPLVVRLGGDSGQETGPLRGEGLRVMQLVSDRPTSLRMTDIGGTAWVNGGATPLPSTSVQVGPGGGLLHLAVFYSPAGPFADIKAESDSVSAVMVGESNLVPNILERWALVATVVLGAIGAGLFATIPWR